MLTALQLENFRCFESLRVEFSPGFNFFIGNNGQGKTSVLEAACVLVRLQSQRGSSLGHLVRLGQTAFSVAGEGANHLLEFRCSPLRRRILFDHVEQRTMDEYLRVLRVVSFANSDIELVRGGSERRRRYLDFVGAQVDSIYRPTLRAYERALRSRNALLKSAHPRSRELAAYDLPLLEHGARLSTIRARLIQQLAPLAGGAHADISSNRERMELQFSPGNSDDFARDLAESRIEEARLRQTIVGPHRDDIKILIEGKPACHYASEGQQRTVVLAMKIAQSLFFANEDGRPPLLLIDDIFGELDPARRDSLVRHLPPNSQKLVTATTMQWLENPVPGPVWELRNSDLTLANEPAVGKTSIV